MDREKIKKFLNSFKDKKDRTVVVIDFGNVEKWKEGLGWKVGIRELSTLVKHISVGDKALRRFYYGSDYGKSELSHTITPWSKNMLDKAKWSRLEVCTKRVKYIPDSTKKVGFEKKCDFDVEMIVDLIKKRNDYDNIVLFSGDGDLMYGIKFLYENYGKKCYVFGARGHIGREIFDAKREKFLEEVLFAEDFEYRLNMNRHTRA